MVQDNASNPVIPIFGVQGGANTWGVCQPKFFLSDFNFLLDMVTFEQVKYIKSYFYCPSVSLEQVI